MQYLSTTYRIFAILLACLVYFTSAGFTLVKHSCKMEKQEVAQKKGLSCADLGGCKKGCCSTDFESFQLDQDQQTVTVSFEHSTALSQFITAVITIFLTDIAAPKVIANFKTYKPPLIQRDIPVLIQSFLL